MLVRWNKASLTWVKVALAMALFSSFTLMAETSASANSTSALYVAQGGAGIGNCADLGDACSSLQTAIGLADGQTNTDVTIYVAAGTYDENDTINLPSTDTLVIQGAGATTTFINGGDLGSDFTIGAGGQVTLEALKIENGKALGVGSGASGYGGGIYNQSGTLTVDDSIFSSDVAIGAPSRPTPRRAGVAMGPRRAVPPTVAPLMLRAEPCTRRAQRSTTTPRTVAPAAPVVGSAVPPSAAPRPITRRVPLST